MIVATGAAEKAVPLQNGGNQPTHLGETAYETDVDFFSRGLGSVSHAAALEASPSSVAADAGGFALDRAAVVLGAVDHDLVLRRFARRALRLGTGLLRGLSPETASARRFAARIPDGPGTLADVCAARPGRRGAAAIGPTLRRCFADRHRRLCAVGLRRQSFGVSAGQGTPSPSGRGGQSRFGTDGLRIGVGALAAGAVVVVASGQRHGQRTLSSALPAEYAAQACFDRGGRLLSRLPVVRGHPGGQGLVFGARVVALATVQGRSGASGAFPPRIGLLLAGEDGARPGQAALATAAAARPRHQGGRVAVDQRARSAR